MLVDYLSFRLVMMKHELMKSSGDGEENEWEETKEKMHINGSSLSSSGIHSAPNANKLADKLGKIELSSPRMKRASKHVAKLKMGDSRDDIHDEAITCIALSLNHRSLRTKALVLELLAAICLVKGGHEIILSAFDRFKDICNEKHRFQTLMGYFMNFDMFHIEFMVACMQFINIVVHSVEDMNFRVHLQHEFTQLGLDDYLEKLRNTESEELQVS